MPSMFLSMKPTGWFQIGWSHEIAVGDVKPMHYFGHDLVVFRTQSGRLVVLNAYCEHLGANMAFGGSVHDEDIQCPFHGWRWNADGKNTCIPYQETTNRVRRVGTWTATERDGVMYLWHDLNGGKPQYEVPGIFELFEGSGLSEDYHNTAVGGEFSRRDIAVHPQYVIENGVDFAHFKYVHRSDEIPEVIRRDFGENNFDTELEMKFSSKRADGTVEEVLGGVLGSLRGMGLAYSYAWGMGGVCSLTATTPIDDETSVVWFTAWVSKEEGDDEEKVARRQRSAINQVKADLRIWEHQRYTEPPGLATAEAAGFRDIRNWARRFYPEGERGHAEQDQLAGIDEFAGAEGRS